MEGHGEGRLVEGKQERRRGKGTGHDGLVGIGKLRGVEDGFITVIISSNCLKLVIKLSKNPWRLKKRNAVTKCSVANTGYLNSIGRFTHVLDKLKGKTRFKRDRKKGLKKRHERNESG